jgi:hypothetical protein
MGSFFFSFKLYKDLRNCRGKCVSNFKMSIESFDELLVLVGLRITYENIRLRLSVPTTKETGSKRVLRKVFHFATRVSSLAVR